MSSKISLFGDIPGILFCHPKNIGNFLTRKEAFPRLKDTEHLFIENKKKNHKHLMS